MRTIFQKKCFDLKDEIQVVIFSDIYSLYKTIDTPRIDIILKMYFK